MFRAGQHFTDHQSFQTTFNGLHFFYTTCFQADRTKAIKVYRQLFEEMRLEQKAGKRLAVAVEGDAGIYEIGRAS